MEELKRLATVAKSFSVPVSLLTPAETKQVFPLINAEVILGALHCPNDGTADPSALCSALTTGAIAAGAQVLVCLYILVFFSRFSPGHEMAE